MRKEIEEVVKDTAAVGLSAAALGLEIGSEVARRALDEVSPSRAPPAPATPTSSSAASSETEAPSAPEPAEDIKVRAYQLWEQAGCPEGRDEEFYFQAEQEQRYRKKPDRTRASDLIA
jgi:hypothetical protein